MNYKNADDMNSKILELTKKLKKTKGASDVSLKKLETDLGFSLPADYVEFMRSTNGAEGFVGGNYYLILWPVEEIIPSNKGYAVDEFTPSLKIFGSNGGGTAYAFDTRSNEVSIVEMPFVSISLDEVKPCGVTFLDFLQYLAAQWQRK